MSMHDRKAGTRLMMLIGAGLLIASMRVAAATEVDVLYGRLDDEDVVGVWWADSWSGGNGRVPYVGAMTAIDYREDRFVSGELVVGGRLMPASPVAPWIGLAVSGGFSQTRQADGDYDSTWSAGLVPEVGLFIRMGDGWGCRLSGRYVVSTEGRDRDFWVAGLGIQWGD